MKIVTVPHPILRQKAQAVSAVTKELIRFVADLEKTLEKTTNPKGVGLAAPQVNNKQRIFTMRADQPQTLINPVITKTSLKRVLGDDQESQILEGCLSIPSIYGPVPRWSWVDVEYLELTETKLVGQRTRYFDYEARVVQHEIDHLDGILFTDYSQEYDLPVYQENDINKKLEPIDQRLLELWQ